MNTKLGIVVGRKTDYRRVEIGSPFCSHPLQQPHPLFRKGHSFSFLVSDSTARQRHHAVN
jgi:hypothetical protein